MIRYALDLYPSDDPKDGTRLARFTYTGTAGALQMAEVEGQANGTGRGIFGIRATSAKAAVIDPAGLQYVRTVRIDTSVVDGATLSGFDELVLTRGGFWIESGQYEILTGTSTEVLTLGGTGTIAYFQRAVMDADSWIDDPFIGTDPQPDGTWPLYLAGTGNELGAILWRVLHELEEPGRHQNPVPAMSLGFTHLLDSNGDPWVTTSGDFVAQVGESVYGIIKRLMELGLYVEMDSDTFEVRAYEPETHRRDRTGGAWATDVVRFQKPSAGTVATGNVKSDAVRAIEPRVRRNAILVGSGDVWEWVTDPGITIPWEGGLVLDDETGDSHLKAGQNQLGARSDAGDVWHLRMKVGDDPVNGIYKPFEDDGVLLDDLVTGFTGTGQWDYNEQDFPVANLKLVLRRGGDWDCWVDLGSTYTSMAERAFQAQPTKAHNHPPDPQLCRIGLLVPPTIHSFDYVSGGTAAGSIVIPAGLTDSILIVFAHWFNDHLPWTASWQGTPMTLVPGSQISYGANAHMEAWYILNPAPFNPGSLLVRDNIPDGTWKGWYLLEGVNQTSPFAAVDTNSGTGATSSVAIPVGNGRLYLNAVGVLTTGMTGEADPVPLGAQTHTDAESVNDVEFGIGADVAAAQWTLPTSRDWLTVGLAVQGTGVGGDGLPERVGTSPRAARCDHTHGAEVGSGIAFPASPTTDDLFYRTDRDLLYFYDGTRWLTVAEYTLSLNNRTLGGAMAASGSLADGPTWGSDGDLFIEKMRVVTFYGGTFAGPTHTWVCNLTKRTPANVSTTIGSVTFDTNGGANQWVYKSVEIDAVVVGSAHITLTVNAIKTNTPPDILLAGVEITYRRVG